MSKGGATPGSPVRVQAYWHAAGELLKAGQYEQVAEILRQTQIASERTGDAMLADTLVAACQVCLACSQCRAQAEWHRQAGAEADRREQELRQKLHAILDLASGYTLPEATDVREGPPRASTVETRPPERGPLEPVRPSLWRRIQNLLGRRAGLQPPSRREALAVSAEVPIPSPTDQAETPAALPVEKEHVPPSLAVYCLGPFRVHQDDKLITDWPSGKGKCIFKYMVANRGRPIPKDILMDLFWRDADPEAARNNLNVAIYGLRQAFRAVRADFSHVLFQDDCYLLNPDLAVWVDAEEFVRRYEAGQDLERRGKLTEAMREYEVAEGLYQGDFLEEDLYEDWLMLQREGLKDRYLVILDRLSKYYLEDRRYAICISICQKILAKDDCREDAHRQLMRCYSRQGQRHLALRQYHLCVEALAQVLDMSPMRETAALYHQIRRGEAV
jgi:DNA-binding SARP family transcriptional activator